MVGVGRLIILKHSKVNISVFTVNIVSYLISITYPLHCPKNQGGMSTFHVQQLQQTYY